MRLTVRCEYALLAMAFLARQSPEAFVPVQAIAQAQKIPPKFLEQILLTLKRARFLRSLKGQRGGYQLGRPCGQISLAEIVRLFDGPLAPTESVSKYFYQPTPIEAERKLTKVFREIRDQLAERLERTTVADIC
jgi:Rrf2 family transcriptional regulator, cysteine metabolism repressor